METIFKLYFDYNNIKLNADGDIVNANDCLYFAEYEWNDETENVGKFVRRVNSKYRHYDETLPMDITVEQMEEMECLDEDFETVQDAWDAIYMYLENYIIWETKYGGYFEPDEYICVGLEDRDETYYRVMAIRAVQERRLQEA